MSLGETGTGKLLVDRLTPTSALLWGWGVWFIIFVFTPVYPRYPNDTAPMFLLLLSLIALFLGSLTPALVREPARGNITNKKTFENVRGFALVLAIIGLAAKIIDLYYFRDIGSLQNIAEIREQVTRTGSNGVSLVAAALGPIGIASALLAAVGIRAGLCSAIGWPTVMVAAGVPLSSIALGSRSLLMESAIFVTLGSVLLFDRITKRTVVALAALLTGAFIAFNLIFLLRLSDYGYDLQHAARYSIYTQLVPTEPWALEYIDSSGYFRDYLISAIATLQYIIDPVFEFFYLVELKDRNFQFGAWEFFYFEKFFNMITGGATQYSEIGTAFLINPRSGAAQTFFGDAYLDFGYFTIVFSFFFGLFASLIRRAVESGNVYLFPFYVYVLTHLLTSPVHGIGGAVGVSDFTLLMFGLGAGSYARLFSKQ